MRGFGAKASEYDSVGMPVAPMPMKALGDLDAIYFSSRRLESVPEVGDIYKRLTSICFECAEAYYQKARESDLIAMIEARKQEVANLLDKLPTTSPYLTGTDLYNMSRHVLLGEPLVGPEIRQDGLFDDVLPGVSL